MIRFRAFVCAVLSVGLVLGGGLGLRRLPASRNAAAHERSALAPYGPRPGGQVSSDQAIATAVNRLEASAGGWRLRHPRHAADFTAGGVQFVPRRGGPAWGWALTWVGAGDQPLAGVDVGAVWPVAGQGAETVTYRRGGLDELYVAKAAAVEQQFVIASPLALGGADLVIVGRVDSLGAFQATADGWVWQTDSGAVRLGQVHAFDADGKALAATLSVSADETRLVVDGGALARAAYPVVIDPEIGANDFRLSDMGGDKLYDAFVPAVAYNSTNNEYLVVWQGDDNTGALANDELEIFGQRVNAATGVEIGGDFRLSDMGPDGDATCDAREPALAYNSAGNQYLVVWQGDDNTGPLVNNDDEIFGQRINAATGAELGGDVRLSDMGPDGDTLYDALAPAVAYNSTDDQYLVVWQGDDDTGALVDDEFEIFGQRVDGATGAEIGLNDFRLSDMGVDGDAAYSAEDPAVAYTTTDNQYLVVWRGDDNTGTLVDGESEIFGQRINAATGAEIGTNDFRLSDMGPDGSTSYSVADPALAYNSTNNQYLVVWQGDDNTGALVDNEREIFGQRVDATTGAEIGSNDFRLSDMGPDGSTSYAASTPAVAYNSTNNQYLVVWSGDDNTGALVDNEREIFGQRVNGATGADIGGDLRLSDMGPDGAPAFEAFNPAAAYNSTNNQYLGVWYADDDTAGSIDEEYEIYGQRGNGATGADIGADVRLSSMGPDRDTLYDAFEPAMAYNSTNNEYLVVWHGDDNTGALVNEESEIFGQRVDAATGAEIGANDFRLSDMGPNGNTNYTAASPAVAYNSTNNQYLVVWQGTDDTGALANNEFEIFGQRVDAATGAEIGANDFRLSDLGPDGDSAYFASAPAVAYNSTNNQYLVVWQGTDDTGALVNNEFEIFGQRVDAATGAEIGVDSRLSDMGPDGDANYDAFDPAVAYNSTNNQYLVVWQGDDNTGALVDDEYEIYGQQVNAATGAEIGTNDLRLSDMGPDGNAAFDASSPAVAYNTTDNQYLVVWWGDDNTGALVDNELEIYGQRVNAATGAQIGTNDFRLSDMGPDGNTAHSAVNPAVTYNSANNEYLVVWFGDDNTGALVDEEFEIFGQRVNAATGAEIRANDFRLSDMGPDGNINFWAVTPVVAYNSTDNLYLAVWHGDDDISGLVDDEFEIFGQRLAVDYALYLPVTVR